MSLHVPFHQVEIRFKPLLNFSSIINEILSPFISLTTDIKIENENNTRAHKVYLMFDRGIMIFAHWDRLVLKCQEEPKSFLEKNSFIEEPFLNIFNKLKTHRDFTNVINILIASTFVRINEKNEQDNLSDFVKNNILVSGTNKIIENPDDAAIILVKTLQNSELTVTYGPYRGKKDLIIRNAFPQEDSCDWADKKGQMAEVKIVETTSTFNFSKYKELVQKSYELTEKL